MDQPANTPALVQPSIRSFFQRRPPAYAAPPASTSPANAPPRQHQHQGTSSHKNNNNENDPPAIERRPPISKVPEPPPLPPQPVSAPRLASPRTQPPPPTLPSLPSLPLLPPPPSLPPQATIAPITHEHIPALRRINSLLLQITYPDSFYTTILTVPASSLFSRAILWSDSPSSALKVVGSIVCRLEAPAPNSSDSAAIYIQSLTLLSPFRSLGLASAALEHVVSTASLLSLDPEAGVDIRRIYAHVWTENEEGLRWYAARGFGRVGARPVAGYYFRLRPDTAWVVSRQIGDDIAEQRDEEMERQDGNGAAADADEARGRGSVLASAVNLPGFSGSPGEGAKVEEEAKKKKLLPRPSPAVSLSYQKTRPDTEWNDLPADMVVSGSSGAATPVTNGAGPPPKATHLSAPGSGASSRSSSSARKKKERAYPAAAFGS